MKIRGIAANDGYLLLGSDTKQNFQLKPSSLAISWLSSLIGK